MFLSRRRIKIDTTVDPRIYLVLIFRALHFRSLALDRFYLVLASIFFFFAEGCFVRVRLCVRVRVCDV